MAIGFQSGMFGRRDPYRRPWDTPGIGDGFNQRMDMPGQASEMPIGVQQINQPPKRGIFGRGGKAWDVLGAFGDAFSENEPIYAMSKQAEQNRLFEAQKAQAQRMQAREDKMWEWQNKPKDAPNPTEFERILAASGLPQDQQIKLMQDYARNRANPPVWRQGPDGGFYRMDTPQGELPTFTDDDWNKAGGSVGNGAGGFRF